MDHQSTDNADESATETTPFDVASTALLPGSIVIEDDALELFVEPNFKVSKKRMPIKMRHHNVCFRFFNSAFLLRMHACLLERIFGV